MAGADPVPPLPRLLIDTDVVLDVLLDRAPWVEDATALLDAIAKGQAEGHVSLKRRALKGNLR